MAWVAVGAAAIGAAGSIGSSLIASNAANKNANLVNSVQYQPIDLNQLQQQAQQTAATNAANSIALEAKNEPFLSQSRFGLQQQVAQDLNSGGNLPTDVYNQTARSAITGADSAGLLGGAGPLTAANLGLTALQLRNQNQAKASNLVNANPLPVSGLDPGTLASAAISQNNAMNQFNLGKLQAMTNANQAKASAGGGLLGSITGGIGSILGSSGGLGGLFGGGGGSGGD